MSAFGSKRRFTCVCLVVLSWVVMLGTGLSQQTTATILGTLTDPSGATIPGVKVTAAYSGASCPLIPVEVVHRFRRKLSSDSGAMLSTFSPERNRWTPSRNEWTPSRNLSE